MNICVIPARGGSKRVPGKNSRDFAGRPMLAWPIASAHASGVFARIIVSTDDDAVAQAAEAAGAEVPFRRPASLADDHTPTIPVIAHTLDWLAQRGTTAEAVCCLYATAAFVRPEDIAAGLTELQNGRHRYVFSAAAFSAPVQRGFTVEASGLRMLHPEHAATRSQDLPPVYHDAGQFYWARPATWRDGAPIFAHGSAIIEVPRERVCDIDSAADWAFAERLMRCLRDG